MFLVDSAARQLQMRERPDWGHEVVQKTYVEWSQSGLTKQMQLDSAEDN
ncbi:MAG: hypothetical protein LKE33_06545 [Acidaminococcus sp.]|nr:hypothetical protein [Acidaminococcus sp.]MCI2100377.1 hypothetical protein [Acidaminococcus sp.]MCI2114698.1 hypothetical protein [Acidaminococcus sp.]MCI2116727.1 hypothetical protein [Acidaminococcus sp.]